MDIRFLQKNEYPPKFTDKSIKQYLSKKIINLPRDTESSKIEENIEHFKLTFIRKFSKLTEDKIRKLTKQFFKESTDIEIVFSSFRLACLFSTKDKVPYGLKFYFIYPFLCAGRNTSYVAESYRNISTMTHEHLETDKNSNIYRHLRKHPQ